MNCQKHTLALQKKLARGKICFLLEIFTILHIRQKMHISKENRNMTLKMCIKYKAVTAVVLIRCKVCKGFTPKRWH